MIRLSSMLIVLTLLSGTASAQDEGSPQSFPIRDAGIGLLQFGVCEGVGAACMGAGYVGLIVGIMSTGEDAWFTPAAAEVAGWVALGAVALSPLAEAGIVSLVGNGFYSPQDRGSFGLTACGAYLGALTGLGIGIVGSLATHQQGFLPSAWYTPVLFLPAVGAVVGYHLTRPRPGDTGFQPARFDLPTVGLRKVGRPSAKGETFPSSLFPFPFSLSSAPALDLRLLGYHF